jgi:uncharacterized protein YndB with AHSA1/START domain
MKLEINAAMQIAKPLNEVFEAIVDPGKMSGYFISESTGRMEAGRELVWKFPEFDDQIPVKVIKADSSGFVSYEWEGSKDKMLLVEMVLTERPGNATLVKITEGAMENDEAGIKWLKSNTEGWANFLACLKAYLEFGINLRKGGFDYMRK